MLQCTSGSPDGQTKGLTTAIMPIGRVVETDALVQSSGHVTGVSPAASLPVVTHLRTSYWPVGTHRIRAGVGEIDAIMTVYYVACNSKFKPQLTYLHDCRI